MMRPLFLMIFIFLRMVSCKDSSTCDQRVAECYLDTAMDLIEKAKSNFPTHCESSVPRKALDCSELLVRGNDKSGIYTVWPVSRVMHGQSIEVYCDMETDGGGWTLIQRRGNFGRAVDYFDKDWKSYKEGFGDIEKDFWLGNDYLFALTNQKLYSVRFDMKAVDNETRYAHYETFWIDDEDHQYTLHIAGYTGDAGDSMIKLHDNQKFSSNDRDNDQKGNEHCSKTYRGGWWYKDCHSANLNGLYLRGKHEGNHAKGINWYSWRGHQESLEAIEIKIRPKMLADSSLFK